MSVTLTDRIPSNDSVQAKSIRVFCFSGWISSKMTFSGVESRMTVVRKISM